MTDIDTHRHTELLAEKKAQVESLFAEFSPPQLQVYPSPPSHYRMRAEFKIWHEGEQCRYVMYPPGRRGDLITIEQFPIGSERINALMTQLMSALHDSQTLRYKLFQVDFLTTLNGDALLTLIYHRRLDEAWQYAAAALESALGCAIIGRSRGQRHVVSRDYVEERLQVNGAPFHYRQPEGGFTQPNAAVNQHMLGWAQQQCRGIGGDLLELYCGIGNFTAVLAQAFDQVLATEISKTAVRAAQINLARNGVDNVQIVRMSSEELTQALAGARPFRRLEDIDLANYRFSTLFVDPPRAGLDAETLAFSASFEHILYISCNPHTLRDNLRTLYSSHRIAAFALFDQFPYTEHIECGVLLLRRADTARVSS